MIDGGRARTLRELDLDTLDPGIRETVALLREFDFDTSDSGDGSKHPHMEDALPYKHVVIVLPDGADMVAEANRCLQALASAGYHLDPVDGWSVTASYSPPSPSRIIVVEGPH